jgi:parallel beta-helix repeat protein
MSSTLTLDSSANGMTFASAPGQHAVLDGGGSLTTLIKLSGASGVTLQGLTFQNTSLNSRAALVLNAASKNSIVGNYFSHNGEGMLLDNNSNNNTVSGNEVDNSATSGIEAQGGSSGNTFDSNVINGTGAIGTAGGGFFFHGVNNNMISHNLVENTAGSGIGVDNWDSSTVNVGNQILDNIVKNTNTSTQSTDSGAIYELGRSQVDTKSVISGNYISGSGTAGNHVVGIYLDDYADGVTITNNIVSGVSMHAVQIHAGSNNTVQNNIFDLSSITKSGVLLQSTYGTALGTPLPMTNNVVSGNIFASTSSSPVAFSNISGGSPSISNNFYMDLINSSFQTGGFSQSNAHYGNAQFNNQSSGDYSLQSTSPVLATGFKSIDQSVIGLHPTTTHWYA